MCAETGHPERVPGDTGIRVYAQFGTLLPDHKSRAVPERAHKASASPLPEAAGAAAPQCPDNAGFPERSGSSLSCTSYHQGIRPRIVEYSSGFMRVSNVAIRDNRNGNFLLNCPNTVVLSISIEQTGAGASMNGQSLNATSSASWAISTQLRCSGAQPVRILSVTGTSTALTTSVSIDFTKSGYCKGLNLRAYDSLFSRTPHIDINNLGAAFHVNTCGIGHLNRVATGNLHRANFGSSTCTIRKRDLSLSQTCGLEDIISDTVNPAPIS